MPREIEAVADESLYQADREVEGPRQHAVTEQRACDRRSAVEPLLVGSRRNSARPCI